ncbi:MAG: IMP dehydrogenase [Thaumarchaeota archaeon]|nr:IMP dehydrogenase [Nitrososphaerota archaeon]
MRVGLTFDDILLVPKKSIVSSRREIDTKTKLSRKIDLNIPIVSANMDTVTESAMAIAIAQLGGIGIIHRFMSIEQQVSEVLKVKRSESILIERPYTMAADRTLGEAKEMMSEHNVSGLLIIENSKLQGILTSRDIIFEDDLDKKVSELMTPRSKMVTAEEGISIDEAKEMLRTHKIEKLPILDKEGKLKGLITSKDIVKRREYPQATKDSKGRLRVGAAIGVKDDFLRRAEALIEAETDALVLDIAHGHSENALRAIARVRDKFGDVELIAGNVATSEGTRELIDIGVDAVKVGVGSGSICITRIVTGAGVPQLTAVMNCAEAAAEKDIPLIADGGIRNSGDMTKALAAGASTVMIGSLLAGTDESPGVTILRNGRRYKVTRGMASIGATMGRQLREKGKLDEGLEEVVPEGVEALVPYRGSASEVINHLVGGLKSGISYSGGKNITDLKHNAEFIRITEAGLKESMPHDVETMK